MGTIKQRISWPHQSWPQKSHMKEMLLFPWWLTSEISRKLIIFANCVKIALKMKIWLVDLKSVTYSIFFVNTVDWRHSVIQFLTMFIYKEILCPLENWKWHSRQRENFGFQTVESDKFAIKNIQKVYFCKEISGQRENFGF